MGRPRKPWKLSFLEVRNRYEEGESSQSLAEACGLVTYQPILQALREAGVEIRRPGGPKGPRKDYQSTREVRTCKGERCDNTFTAFRSSNKRYCSPPCRYTSPELANLLARNIQNRHYLTAIDEDGRTAVCSVCGPIDVRRRVGETVFGGSVVRWRCRGAERARDWARLYGMEAEAVKTMWERQGRRCAICRLKVGISFHVDHCHDTGAVRGLLCSKCNTGLGLFADEPERLRAAIEYIERSRV